MLEFIRREAPFVFTVNFADPKFRPDACFVSSHKRLDIIGPQVRDMAGARLILTSNLAAYGGEGCLFVDYGQCVNEDGMVSDNAGLMLLKLLERCGARQVFLAGFDGFRPQPEASYYSREAVLPVNAAELFERQRRMGEQLRRLPLEMVFLTPSAYEDREGKT